MYIIENLCTLFEKLYVLNVQNCIHWVYIIENLCTFFENLYKSNVQNSVCYLKVYVRWTYKIVYIFWKIMYLEYANSCIVFKNLHTLIV